MTRTPRCTLALVVVVTAFIARPVQAQRCAAPGESTASSIARQTDDHRLVFLAQVVSTEAKNLGRWKLVFGATFALLAVGQLAARPLFAQETQTDYFWGAAYSALGLASTLVGAPEAYSRGADFAIEAERATEENRCALIAEGERLLKVGAEAETLTGRWYVHALNVAVNASLALIIGLGYHRWGTALLDFLVGTALSETMLFTKPTGLGSGWQRYTSSGGRPAPVAFRFSASPTFQGGFALGLGGAF